MASFVSRLKCVAESDVVCLVGKQAVGAAGGICWWRYSLGSRPDLIETRLSEIAEV